MGLWKPAAAIVAGVMMAAPALAQDRAAGLVRYLDLDRDGQVSLNEYLNFQQPRLAEFDENGNGRLSKAEFKASLSEQGKGNADRSFRAFDRNSNNGLEEREFLGYHAYVFKNVIDKNGDEQVTAEEMAALGD